ncbi:MAG: hypothetical protein AAF581_08460 [Planctomycetota bacterium]
MSVCFLLGGVGSASAQYTSLPTMSLAGTDPNNSNPYGLAMHPTLPLGYVALAGITDFTLPPATSNGSTVAEFDLSTLQITRTFSVGLFPTEIAIAPDGSELYVVCSTDSTVAFIDLATTTVTQLPITDSTGALVSFVSGIQLSADGTQLYVVSNGGDFDGSNENIVIIDRALGTIVGRQLLAGSMSRFAVLSNGRVVAPVGFPGNDFTAQPELRIYDPATTPWTQLASLPMTVDTTTFPSPIDVAVAPDELRAYVTIFEGSSEVFVVDLVTNTLLPSIVLPTLDFVQHGLEMSADGMQLYVTDFLQSQLRVVDLATGTVAATLATGAQPNEVVEHGGRLWITDQASQTVTLYALAGGYVRGDIDDNGGISLTDAIGLLMHLFVAPSLTCLDRGDTNDDGQVDLVDPVLILDYLFNAGPAPAYPFPQVGTDLTADTLSCP